MHRPYRKGKTIWWVRQHCLSERRASFMIVGFFVVATIALNCIAESTAFRTTPDEHGSPFRKITTIRNLAEPSAVRFTQLQG